jgi:hypothetical protein
MQSTRPFSIWRELKGRFEVIDEFPISNIPPALLRARSFWGVLGGLTTTSNGSGWF